MTIRKVIRRFEWPFPEMKFTIKTPPGAKFLCVSILPQNYMAVWAAVWEGLDEQAEYTLQRFDMDEPLPDGARYIGSVTIMNTTLTHIFQVAPNY
jgi:hypothetical protein